MSRIKRELDESDQEHVTRNQRIINRLAAEIVSITAEEDYYIIDASNQSVHSWLFKG